MATQQEYSYLANALVGYAHHWISTLPAWQQSFIPMDKVPAAAGALAKFAIDTDEQYRATHSPPDPPTQPQTIVEPDRVSARVHKPRRKRK